MKHITFPLLALAAGALLIPSTSAAAPGGAFGSKLRSRLTIQVDLFPTPEGTAGSAGEMEIKVKQKDAIQDAKLGLSVEGIPAGAYSLDATLDNGTPVHLGEFETEGAATPAAGDDDGEEDGDNELEMKLPSTIDARAIASVTVSNAAGTVVLEGDAEAFTDRESYFANVAVTGEGSRVHGHALLISKTEETDEVMRKVLFIGFGAPGSATLTINVNGVAVGTTQSTKQGKVKFQELDEDIVLSTISLITLTDESNTAVMQAQF